MAAFAVLGLRPGGLLRGHLHGEAGAALGLLLGVKAPGPGVVGAGGPVGQGEGELSPIRRSGGEGAVPAVGEGVDAGGQSGRLGGGYGALGRKAGSAGAVHQSVLGAGRYIGGVPGVSGHVGKGGGPCRQRGGEEGGGQDQSGEDSFHGKTSIFRRNLKGTCQGDRGWGETQALGVSTSLPPM